MEYNLKTWTLTCSEDRAIEHRRIKTDYSRVIDCILETIISLQDTYNERYVKTIRINCLFFFFFKEKETLSTEPDNSLLIIEF